MNILTLNPCDITDHRSTAADDTTAVLTLLAAAVCMTLGQARLSSVR